MQSSLIVTPFLFLLLAGVVILLLLFFAILVWILKAIFSRKDKSESRQERARESKAMQETYRGMEKLENRIESLETLLMDKFRR